MMRELRDLTRLADRHGFAVAECIKGGRYRLVHRASGRTCITTGLEDNRRRVKPAVVLKLRRVAANLVR